MNGQRMIVSCDRCGIRRAIKPDRPNTGLCRDCYVVEPGWPDSVRERRAS